MILETDEIELTETATETAPPAQVEWTDEQFEAQLQKRFGAGSKELVKKSEQIVVLTEAEKLAIEEKENDAALITGLAEGWTTKKEYDGYADAIKTDPIEYVRKKYIREHPELGDKADAIFNKLFKVDEDDELEGDEELFVPNEDKKAARLLAKQIADNDITNTYGQVIKLKSKYADHLAQGEIKKVNTELITKSIAAIPRQMPIVIDNETYSIEVSEEDIKEAQDMVISNDLIKKGLTEDEIKGNAALFLKTKNIDRIIKEVRDIAVAEALDKNSRGLKGIVPVRKDNPVVADAKTEFLRSKGIIK